MSWSFVGVASAASVASGNLTLTEPAGVASGDLLVATIAYRSTAAFTLPSGWTLIGTQQSSGDTTAGGGIASGVMAYIVRGGSAPALTFTRAAGDVAYGTIVAYRSEFGSIALDGASTATMGSAGTAVSASEITTTKPMALVVAAVATPASSTTTNVSGFIASGRPNQVSGATTTATAVTVGDWIERFDNSTTTGADASLTLAEAVKGGAGSTGTLSATASVSARQVYMAAAFTEADPTPSGQATWDPDFTHDYVLSGGNLTLTANDSSNQYFNWSRGTHGKTSGKWYWELTATTATHADNANAIGWAKTAHDYDRQRDATDTAAIYWGKSGSIRQNNTAASLGSVATWATGDTLCLAADLDASPPKFWFRKGAGNWNNSGTADPATGVGGITSSGIAAGDKLWPLYSGVGGSTEDSTTVNFGTAVYSVPTGFTVFNAEPVTGTLSATDGADALAATGSGSAFGPLTATEGADSATGAGTVDNSGIASGSMDCTDGADTASIEAWVEVSGTLDATEGADGLDGIGVRISLPTSTAAPPTSGRIGQNVLTLQEILDAAFGACKLVPQNVTPEMLHNGKRALQRMLNSLPARVSPLWAREHLLMPFEIGKRAMALPVGTIDVVSAQVRSFSRYDASFTAAGTVNTFTLSDAVEVAAVCFRAETAGLYSLIVQTSEDGSTWDTVYDPGQAEYASQLEYWIEMDPIVSAAYVRLLGIEAADLYDFIIAGDPRDRDITRMSLHEHTAYATKTAMSVPLRYWVDRKASQPEIVFWPLPGETTEMSVLSLWRQRHIEDVGSMAQSLEIPPRWEEPIIFALAWRIAMLTPQIDAAVAAGLKPFADEAIALMAAEERDQGPMTFQFNLRGYTR